MIKLATIPLIAAMLFMIPGSAGIPNMNGQEKSATSVQIKTVTFKLSIGPLLKANCSPCHFEGGKVFDRYPFDQYETVRKLGKRLNTRLKSENADLVTRWINNGSPEGTSLHEKKP